MNNHSFASLVLMERTSPTNPKTRHIKVPMICRLWLAPLQILLMSTQQLEKAHLSTEWWCFPPPSLSTTMDLTKDWSKDVRVVDLVGKVTTVGAVIQKQKKCKWTINHSGLELLGTSGLMGCGWSSERSSLKELDALEASGTRVPRNSTDNT